MHVIVLHLQEQVLVNLNVGDDGIDGLHRLPTLATAIGIILAIHLEPRGARHSHGGIPAIGLAFTAITRKNALCMGILSTYRPVVVLILHTSAPTVAVNRHPILHIVACPAEHTDVEVLDWLHLQGAEKVFATVLVAAVDALTVHHLQLVVQETVTILLRGEEVTLHLQALVTASIGHPIVRVANAGNVAGNLRVVACPHIPRVVGILEGEGSLVLTHLHGQFLPVRPLHEVVLHVDVGVVHLHLNTILEVGEDGAIHIEANEPLAEAVAPMCAVLVAVGILANEIAPKLRRTGIVGQFASQLRFLTWDRRVLHGTLHALVHQVGHKA